MIVITYHYFNREMKAYCTLPEALKFIETLCENDVPFQVTYEQKKA